MPLDVELYRRTVYAPIGSDPARVRRLSVIDIAPEGAERAMVLVHGYGGRAMQWIYQLRTFGQTMRVVAPDLRGHGQTDDPDEVAHAMDGLVADLELVLGRTGVPKPFVLVAHSFGGAIAVEYTLRHPTDVSHLVLMAVPTRFILRPGTRPLMSVPGPVFETLVDWLKIALYASSRTLRHMHDSAMSGWRGDQRLPQLKVPALVILGQRDTVFDQDYYAGVARSIPGAKQVVIPVSAHLVQLERSEATNRAIRRFIETHPPNEQAPSANGAPMAGATPTSKMTLAARYAAMPWLQAYDPEVPETLPTPRGLLHELVSNAAGDFPERAALIYFGQKIGYRELDYLSNRFAHALRRLGIARGDRVAIVLPNVPQCVIAFIGTLKAGAVAVLGSPLSTEQEIEAQIRDSDARVLLTLNAYKSLADRMILGGSMRHIIYSDVREYLPLAQRVALASLIAGSPPHADQARVVATHAAQDGATPQERDPLPAPLTPPSAGKASTYAFQELLRSQPTTPLDAGVTSEDLALLQYTSGTTGSARGVMLTHANLVVNTAQTRHWIPMMRRGKETLLCALPLSHSYGLTSGLNLTMALAGTLVLLPTTRIDQIMRAIKRYHPSMFPGIPAFYLAIANYPHVRRYGMASIRVCVSGSAPLPVEVQEAFEKLTRGRLVEGYGLTEASPVTHSNPLNGERRVGSIGLPYPSTQARIVDTGTGETLPPGAVGELVIRGPQVMHGYWNRPEDTAHALADGWLHTGDLARMDEDGFFTIVDRQRDVILAGPYNVYPRDVEEVLYEHPKVLEAAVVGASDPAAEGSGEGGAQTLFIKAVVVLKRGERATADELLALCRERLDAYKVPRQIEFRTELPKNIVGKVLRRLLVEG